MPAQSRSGSLSFCLQLGGVLVGRNMSLGRLDMDNLSIGGNPTSTFNEHTGQDEILQVN